MEEKNKHLKKMDEVPHQKSDKVKIDDQSESQRDPEKHAMNNPTHEDENLSGYQGNSPLAD